MIDGGGSKLEEHMTKHMRETMQCTLCQYVTKKSCHLKIHMVTHSGKKPFECPECSKSFPLASKLKRHMLMHTGEKLHKCTKCDMSLIQMVI